MTEQERSDKLKARMSRWQAYVDRPHGNTLPQRAEAAEIPEESHQGLTVRTLERPQPVFRSEPVGETTHTRREVRTEAPAPDPLIAMREAQIADLQTVLAREREQVDRLAGEVKRAQTLHAATIYSHLAEERGREGEHRAAQRQIPETPDLYEYDARRKNLARLLGLLLVITSVLTVVFFITR